MQGKGADRRGWDSNPVPLTKSYTLPTTTDTPGDIIAVATAVGYHGYGYGYRPYYGYGYHRPYYGYGYRRYGWRY